MLSEAKGLTIETMAPIQYDSYDKGAERFIPILIRACRMEELKEKVQEEILDKVLTAEREKSAQKPIREAGINNKFVQKVLEVFANWDYVAKPEAIGPVVWLRWFEIYRDMAGKIGKEE